jgi:hypothetical protein
MLTVLSATSSKSFIPLQESRCKLWYVFQKNLSKGKEKEKGKGKGKEKERKSFFLTERKKALFEGCIRLCLHCID